MTHVEYDARGVPLARKSTLPSTRGANDGENRADGPAQAPPRAFPIFDSVPEGCTVHLQRHHDHAPHIRPGEWAVVDCRDRVIVLGEAYLFRQSTKLEIWLCLRPERAGGFPDSVYRALLAQLSPGELPYVLKHGMRPDGRMMPIADGWMYNWAAQRRVIGRVIGILSPAGADR